MSLAHDGLLLAVMALSHSSPTVTFRYITWQLITIDKLTLTHFKIQISSTVNSHTFLFLLFIMKFSIYYEIVFNTRNLRLLTGHLDAQ